MYKNGIELEVVVDDFICCRWSMPCFARAKGNELWVGLAEKAWAKIHGSYHSSQDSWINTMKDLTGAPSYVGFIILFSELVEAVERNYMIMVIGGYSAKGYEDKEDRQLGPNNEKSYSTFANINSVIKATTVELEG